MIKQFQKKNFLNPDGIMGKNSANKIKGVFCDCNRNFAIHFLAQLSHETGNLYYDTEIISEKKANSNYGGRMGNDKIGDGYKYRGRGSIMLTGKSNYERFSKAVGDPEIVYFPEKVSKEYYFDCAKWYFDDRNIWRFCGKLYEENIKHVTKMINGGYNGLKDRIEQYNKFKKMI